jgi:hypothetical protein
MSAAKSLAIDIKKETQAQCRMRRNAFWGRCRSLRAAITSSFTSASAQRSKLEQLLDGCAALRNRIASFRHLLMIRLAAAWPRRARRRGAAASAGRVLGLGAHRVGHHPPSTLVKRGRVLLVDALVARRPGRLFPS